MKQATLKRAATSTSSARKKIQTLPGSGTAAEPFSLDEEDNRESPIDLDALDSQEVIQEAGPSEPTNTVKNGTLSLSGPARANPLNINEPTFDVKASFTNIKPQVILKDPDLDLLYFKRMSMCLLKYASYKSVG